MWSFVANKKGKSWWNSVFSSFLLKTGYSSNIQSPFWLLKTICRTEQFGALLTWLTFNASKSLNLRWLRKSLVKATKEDHPLATEKTSFCEGKRGKKIVLWSTCVPPARLWWPWGSLSTIFGLGKCVSFPLTSGWEHSRGGLWRSGLFGQVGWVNQDSKQWY